MDRLKVGIIFGGCSEEHPVSVKSAQEVAKNLDAEMVKGKSPLQPAHASRSRRTNRK